MALIVSYVSHDKFVSVNNVLREYYEMKKKKKKKKKTENYVEQII